MRGVHIRTAPTLGSTNPEDVPVIQDARIFTVGNYAIPLATTDNDKAQEAIVKLLGDKAQINTKNENPGIPVTSDEETTPETEFSYPVESVAVVDIESEPKSMFPCWNRNRRRTCRPIRSPKFPR